MSGFADGWHRGMPETRCGGGSMLANTKAVRDVLPQWIAKYRIETLNDAGAGDLNWISQVPLTCQYTPYDLIQWHPKVTPWDIREKPLPPSDAVLCRHVLNHLSDEDALRALRNMQQSAKYLILTTGKPKERTAVGHFYDYDLIAEPFNLGKPLESVEDYRGLLGLWRS